MDCFPFSELPRSFPSLSEANEDYRWCRESELCDYCHPILSSCPNTPFHPAAAATATDVSQLANISRDALWGVRVCSCPWFSTAPRPLTSERWGLLLMTQGEKLTQLPLLTRVVESWLYLKVKRRIQSDSWTGFSFAFKKGLSNQALHWFDKIDNWGSYLRDAIIIWDLILVLC